MATMEELEARIELLEFQVAQLIELADGRSFPLALPTLYSGLKKEEVQALHRLMDKTRNDIEAGRGPTRNDFEMALNAIKPLKSEDWDSDDRASWYHAGVVAEHMCQIRRWFVVGEYLKNLNVTF